MKPHNLAALVSFMLQRIHFADYKGGRGVQYRQVNAIKPTNNINFILNA